MKLRNKKTGETGYYLHTHRDHNTGTLKVAVLKDGVPFSEFKPHEPIYDYDSLAELNNDWEDDTPKEPLIKDEKIRKAVRAWVDLYGYKFVTHRFYSTTTGYRWSLLARETQEICLPELDGLDESKDYTIAELCGEDGK